MLCSFRRPTQTVFLRHMTLTFWHENKWVSRAHVCVTFGDRRRIISSHNVWKNKQTNKQTNKQALLSAAAVCHSSMHAVLTRAFGNVNSAPASRSCLVTAWFADVHAQCSAVFPFTWSRAFTLAPNVNINRVGSGLQETTHTGILVYVLFTT